MKLKADSSARKLRGAYYTPLPLAEMMVKLFADNPEYKRVLEPSCGDGVFLEALISTDKISKCRKIEAVEIDGMEAQKAGEKAAFYKNVEVIRSDFFDFYEQKKDCAQYDLILGNPPYIRYQYLEDNQRELMSGILTSQGMKANKLVNTWVGFIVSCVNLLSEHGKIAFVIPAEIMQVAYAEDLRLFLADHLSKITLLTFKELVFPDIEQEIVVFIGEKGEEEKGIRIAELNNLDDLKTYDIEKNDFQKLQHVHEKWTKYFTDLEENMLVKRIREDHRFQKLSDMALINIGITTGNNKYFSVTHGQVVQYALQDVVRPLIGRSSHANSVYFKKEDWLKNVEENRAAYLIDFPDIAYAKYPKKHKEYIKEGEKNGENKGYKCSIRERWYRVPSIWVPDAFFLRRNNLYPKFVLNQCDAVSTDTMHRIKFHDGIEPERAILSYYNSISFAFTELCGRSYGGGVLEVLPGEMGEILVPKLDSVPMERVRELLKQVDLIIRNNGDIEEALDLVDAQILVAELGFEPDVCADIRCIWKKLQRRRLNRG